MDPNSEYEKLQADLRAGRTTPSDLLHRARVNRSQTILLYLRAIFAFVGQAIARLVSRRRKLQALHELSSSDDRMLRDVGVTRYDVNAAIRSAQRNCDDT